MYIVCTNKMIALGCQILLGLDWMASATKGGKEPVLNADL